MGATHSRQHTEPCVHYMADHDILTIEEVADYLRVSERTVYDWANKGDLPCGKIGTTWRFKRVDIEAWVDQKLSRKRAAPAGLTVAVGDVLSPDRVVLMDVGKKVEALNTLIATLGGAPQVKSADELANEIFEREKLMSTGIGFSVAVPHVRLSSVTDLVMAVGINKNDITDYIALDERPVRIICMVAARADQHAQYLKTLGAVSSLLKTDAVRDALLAAPSAEAAYGILTQ